MAARKGARTKRESKDLAHAVHCQRLMRAGMTPQEIAVSEGAPLREILRLLRLAAFIPHPIGRAIGLGATVAEEGFRIAEGRLPLDVSTLSKEVQRAVDNVSTFQKTVENLQKQFGDVLKRTKGLP